LVGVRPPIVSPGQPVARSGIDALAATYLDALTQNWDSIAEADVGQSPTRCAG